MCAKSPNPTSPGFTHTRDLVNGPFAVIKSGASLLATLACAFDVQGLQVTGLYDAEAWDQATLHPILPSGLLFFAEESSGASGYPCHSTTYTSGVHRPQPLHRGSAALTQRCAYNSKTPITTFDNPKDRL